VHLGILPYSLPCRQPRGCLLPSVSALCSCVVAPIYFSSDSFFLRIAPFCFYACSSAPKSFPPCTAPSAAGHSFFKKLFILSSFGSAFFTYQKIPRHLSFLSLTVKQPPGSPSFYPPPTGLNAPMSLEFGRPRYSAALGISTYVLPAWRCSLILLLLIFFATFCVAWSSPDSLAKTEFRIARL